MQYRRSKQREAIFEYLRSNDAHPTAHDIYEAVRREFPALSLGTVYRNLNILEEQGKVRKLTYGSTFDRYDADVQEHYHFICRSCGRVYDLHLDPQYELNRKAEEISDHAVEDHTVDFYGLCSSCRRGGSDRG
jgi:Fur family peroxide stress response transcriptional regulator